MNNVKDPQQEIINLGLDVDVLVNAGAGSGKTYVLKQKIAKHLKNKEISPSELLVLTFTNNAAHDMKVKIIDEVNKIEQGSKLTRQELEEIKNSINSAHIQTFDSFAQEIVTAYAYKLNIPNTFFVANDFVLEAKKREIVDQIFAEKYEANDSKFIDLISQFNTRDDKKTKHVVLDLYDKLQRYSPKRQKEIIAKIKSNFNNPVLFKRWFNEFRNKWIEDQIASINKDSKISLDNKPKAIAKLPAKAEIELGVPDLEYKKYNATSKYVDILISIYYEIVDRMNKYKTSANVYTFSDIANMACKLLTDEQFKDVAEEVRNKFKYIMVDEYQDTNDIQEDVIKSLIATKKDGTRNHLFAVGDPKQSIYGFRNANINIFLDRQKEMELSKDGKVMPMYYNFRSFSNVIDDINTIFKKYMTFEHGGIKYDSQGQTLQLAPLHNKWANNDYGLHILTTDDANLLVKSTASQIRLWECKAILQDIIDKVNNHYQIYDPQLGKYRDCQYKDFYILVRTKGSYSIYEREFRLAGIELNNQIETNLVEVNAIMLITTIIKALALIEKNDYSKQAHEKFKHIFASYARSYICKDRLYEEYGDLKYTDQYIYDQIKNDTFMSDPFFKDLKVFYEMSKGKPFSMLLIQILDRFGINSLLHEIGEVEKNAAKIESLYQLILSIEQSGGTIKNFSSLLDIISKHNIDIPDKTIVDLDNAVTLMTIHQSKGLQNKIVYLPNSVNHLGGQSNMDKPDYDFDEEFGILLPTYDYDDYRNSKEYSETYPKGGLIYSIPYRLYKLTHKENKKDIDEHVRLFYVALTRAEQSIYVVGYPQCKMEEGSYKIVDRTKETLFHMLSYAWGQYGYYPYKEKGAFPKGKWIYTDIKKQPIVKPKILEISNIHDKEFEYIERHISKASQLPNIGDIEIINQRIALGNDLHAIMERLDFNNPNLDFITNKDYKDTISKVLDMDLFKKDLKNATFYPEYEYYDDIFNTTGYIDLLAISKDNVYYIIDYKLFNIDKKEYEKQLHIYQRNIKRIFNIDKSKIKLVLVSLEKQDIKLIQCEEK